MNQSSLDDKVTGIFIGIILICILLASIIELQFVTNTSELTARVLSTDIKQIDKSRSVYLISVEPVNESPKEVLSIEDSAVHGQFRSSDLYFELKNNIGAIYHFKLFGWRDGYSNKWRTVYEITKIESGR